jgi:hypothetical protein
LLVLLPLIVLLFSRHLRWLLLLILLEGVIVYWGPAHLRFKRTVFDKLVCSVVYIFDFIDLFQEIVNVGAIHCVFSPFNCLSLLVLNSYLRPCLLLNPALDSHVVVDGNPHTLGLELAVILNINLLLLVHVRLVALGRVGFDEVVARLDQGVVHLQPGEGSGSDGLLRV